MANRCPYCKSFSVELRAENAHCWDCDEDIEYFDLIQEPMGIVHSYAEELRDNKPMKSGSQNRWLK